MNSLIKLLAVERVDVLSGISPPEAADDPVGFLRGRLDLVFQHHVERVRLREYLLRECQALPDFYAIRTADGAGWALIASDRADSVRESQEMLARH